ncbi:hypothetical protein [uncultured Psychroserpens sp.]|uniref:hypothetical protein n=1 Tax=uncultured Psychroserpens sp. TaxID=255436 RepID=UPI00263012A3|nr:hypothetical protein [uncultured Psychroserpens sp.]
MHKALDIYNVTLPNSRKADFHLSCLDSSVFIDYNYTENKKIALVRISFDGFGCCELNGKTNCLSIEESEIFVREIKQVKLNKQLFTELFLKSIAINKELIWNDALEKYNLI